MARELLSGKLYAEETVINGKTVPTVLAYSGNPLDATEQIKSIVRSYYSLEITLSTWTRAEGSDLLRANVTSRWTAKRTSPRG